MSVIFNCLGGDWTPAFGDRGFQAWVTVLVYLACAFLAVAVRRDRTEPMLRRFWGLIAVLMLFLAVNKQLDLQTALTETGRCLSKAQGWHGYRRYVQLLFVFLVGAAVLLAVSRGVRMMRGYLPSHWMVLTGTALVGGYVLIRASSFHAVDMVGGTRFLGLSANFLLENVGLVLVALNAIWLLNGRIALTEADLARRERTVSSWITRPKTARRQSGQDIVTPHMAGEGPFSVAPPRPLTSTEVEAAKKAVGAGADEHRPFRPLKPRGH